MEKNKDDLQDKIARLSQQATQLFEHGQYKDAIGIATQLCKIAKQYFGENNSGGRLKPVSNHMAAKCLSRGHVYVYDARL
jgi:hypothetical protein